MRLRRLYFNKLWGMEIGEGSTIAMSARLDRTNPRGIKIGKYSTVTFDAAILTHDYVNAVHTTTTIGDYCLIGARSLIYPGVTIGDHCIISMASVVMKDVPSNSLVAGNPARVIESGIMTGELGKRLRPTDDAGNAGEP
jgi:acetyltransferase-like isoleucine patch superfamily enzyme